MPKLRPRISQSANGEGSPVADGHASIEITKSARHSATFAVGLVASAIMQFAFYAMLTHSVRARVAGAVFESIAFFAILSNVAELGADTGLLRFMPSARLKGTEEAFRVATASVVPPALVSAAISIVAFALAPEIAALVSKHNASAVEHDLRSIVLFLPASTVLAVASAGLRAWEARLPVALNYLVVPICRVGIYGLMLALGAAGVAGVAWAAPYALTCSLSVVFLLARLADERPLNSSNRPAVDDRSTFRTFWAFAWPRSFAASFQVLITWLDVLLVGAILSSQDAAVYSTAGRYLVLSSFGLSAIVAGIAPTAALILDRGDLDHAEKLYRSSTRWAILITWPVLIVLALVPRELMQVFGTAYQRGSTTLAILSAAMMVFVGTGPNGMFLLMGGKSSVNLAIQGLSLSVNVVLNLLLLPRVGLIGAPIAWAVAIVVDALSTALMLKQHFNFHPFDWRYALAVSLPLGVFGVAGLVARFGANQGVVATVILILGATAIYAFFLALFRRQLGLDLLRGIVNGVGR
jgi:O-antigen/teichoic acid export membrane protein